MKKRRTKDRMLYINGSKTSFHCECGCNVFSKKPTKALKFICNSCGASYTVETQKGE